MSFLRAATWFVAASTLVACGGRFGLEDADGADGGADASADAADAAPVCAKSGYLCDGDELAQCAGGKIVPITRCAPGQCDAAGGRCATPQACTSDLACTPRGPCTTGACKNGTCAFVPSPAGAPCPGGTCDGAGSCETAPGCKSDDECGVSPCAQGYCSNGACGTKPFPPGTPCPGGTCDGNGSCGPMAGCTADWQCPAPPGPECMTARCLGGACAIAPAPVGTPCPGGACDANGNCTGATCSAGSCGSCPSLDECAQCCVDQDPGSYDAFLKLVVVLCVCQPNAACEKACVGPGGSGGPQCQVADPYQIFQSQKCIDCVNGAQQCIEDAAQKCFGDPVCEGYLKCSSTCPQN